MVDALTKWAHTLTAAFPKGAGMRELERQHGKWLATAKLGVRYYAPDSYFEWQDGMGAEPVLCCYHSAIFDDQGRDRLYSGMSDSIALWLDWGPLTDQAPKMPPRPVMPFITGDLRDWENPERWDIKTVTR